MQKRDVKPFNREIILQLPDSLAGYEAAEEALTKHLKTVQRELFQWMQDEEISYRVLGRKLNTSHDSLYSAFNEDKDFYMPLNALVKFAHTIQNMSVHELLFGENGTSRMSKIDSFIIEAFLGFESKEKKAPRSLCRLLWNEEYIFREDRILKNYRDYTYTLGLLHERCNELVSDSFHSLHYMFKNIVSLKNIRYFLQKFETHTMKRFPLPILMYLAIRWDTSVDYFISTDYSQFSSPVLNSGKKFVRITESDRRFIQNYLELSDQSRSQVAELIFKTFVGRNNTVDTPHV